MTDRTEKERLAILETQISTIIPNIARSLDEIRESVLRGENNDKSISNDLAVIKHQQVEQKTYQDKCEADRFNHALRIASVEIAVKNQGKINLMVASGASSVVALVATALINWFTK